MRSISALRARSVSVSSLVKACWERSWPRAALTARARMTAFAIGIVIWRLPSVDPLISVENEAPPPAASVSEPHRSVVARSQGRVPVDCNLPPRASHLTERRDAPPLALMRRLDRDHFQTRRRTHISTQIRLAAGRCRLAPAAVMCSSSEAPLQRKRTMGNSSI